MTAKPKSCPFCGSSRVEVWETWHPNFTLQCAKCGAVSPCAASEEDAIEWWNVVPRRINAKTCARLKAALGKARRERIRRKAEVDAKTEKTERERSTWAAKRKAWLRAPIASEATE